RVDGANDREPALAEEGIERSEARVQAEPASVTRGTEREEAPLGKRDRRPGGRVGRVVVEVDDRVPRVVAARQEDANERSVVPGHRRHEVVVLSVLSLLLGERVHDPEAAEDRPEGRGGECGAAAAAQELTTRRGHGAGLL